MGVQQKNRGYSATLEGFFVFGQKRLRLAKTNGSTFTLSESCELSPGTEGELLVIVDGEEDSQRVRLPDGVAFGETIARYELTVPF